jgi:hypothetical protein
MLTIPTFSVNKQEIAYQQGSPPGVAIQARSAFQEFAPAVPGRAAGEEYLDGSSADGLFPEQP